MQAHLYTIAQHNVVLCICSSFACHTCTLLDSAGSCLAGNGKVIANGETTGDGCSSW